MATGAAIGIALAGAPPAGVGRVYRADLLGAGAGALAVPGLLGLLPLTHCLRLTAAAALLAALVTALAGEGRRWAGAGVVALALPLVALWPDDWLHPRPSPFKELSVALAVPGAAVIAERSGPLGELAVVASPLVPFRWAPGQSLLASDEPPPQLGIFTDGAAMNAITRFDGNIAPLRFLDAQPAALPYYLRPQPQVLVLGAGGGAEVLRARLFDSARIDAVEVNEQVADLVRGEFAPFAGHLYTSPPVRLHIADARSFAAASTDRWDIVVLPPLDPFGGGLHGSAGSPLYTVEAFGDYLGRLAPRGLLAVGRWASAPPRDTLRAFATAVEALRRRGISDPGRHLAWIRGWRTTAMLVTEAPLTDAEIAAVRTFATVRGFDLAWLPGLRPEESNRFDVLERDWYAEGARALLGRDAAAFLARYPFDVEPATDDRPFFFHTLKLKTLLELLGRPERAALNMVEWGYPLLLATLVQALVASLLLIAAPLLALRQREGPAAPAATEKGRVLVFFAALGLAFLFIEIAFIQRLQTYLGNPVHAVAIVLAGFLVFAELGSGLSARASGAIGSRRRCAAAAIFGIALATLAAILLLDDLTAATMRLPPAIKAVLCLLAIAPLAFCMGMPFPLGLAQTQRTAPVLLPWAWAINGCASVISATLATLLAMQFGLTMLLVMAMGLYALALLAFPGGNCRKATANGRSGRTRTGDP